MLGVAPRSWSAERPRVFAQLPAGFPGVAEGETPWVVANELLVRVRPESLARLQTVAPRWGQGVRWVVPRARVALAGLAAARGGRDLAVVTVPWGTDLRSAADALRRDPDVLDVEPNLRLQLTRQPSSPGSGSTVAVEDATGTAVEPDDFEFHRQWGLRNTGQTGGVAGADLHVTEAWALTTGSSNLVVAVIDTGIDYFHPDLEANIWVNRGEIPGNGIDDDGNGRIDDVHGFDFVSHDGDPLDDNVHGTHVAGIIGAVGNNRTGVAGVAWNVRLMALKAFDDSGGGSLDDALAAIAYATANGARIINASWGTTTRSRSMDELISSAVAQGVVFVAAAGNNGNDAGFYPAAALEVLAVGATDASDKSATFSNFGRFVDVVAPGDSIYSTTPDTTWSVLSGTSMAAPHVTGVVALMLSLHPELTPAEVSAILRSTAVELSGNRFTGAGRVDAGRAVRVTEPLPTARLNLPAVVSGRVDLRGTAAGNRFAGYRLEIGLGDRPTNWTTLAAAALPVTEEALVRDWETPAWDDGDYTVRLTVTNRFGDAAVERASLAIRNVQFSSLANNDIRRRGESLIIPGTVFGEGRTFEVSWGLGRDPVEWRTNGVRNPAGGQGPIVNGVLGVWDTAQVGTNAFVTLRLEAKRDGRVVGSAFARLVFLEDRLRPGWPIYLPFNDEFPAGDWREFNVADLDGDGKQEVILVDHGEPGGRPPRLWVVQADGLVRWSRDLPAGAPEHDAPVVGDVDGDGRAEIFVDTGDAGAIAAFNADGEPLSGWPVQPGGRHFGKILADLDGDRRLELIALSNPPKELGGIQQRQLVVIDANGAVRKSWTLGWCFEDANVPELLPAVGNLDQDPELEIVAPNGCLGVSAFDLEGGTEPTWTAPTDGNIFSSPVVGDLDGDGTEEVLVACARRDRGLPGGLYVFDHTGHVRGGWPVLNEESFQGGLALGDLNGDGRLEVAVASWESERVHVIDADGFELPGWPTAPLRVSATRSSPILGDVDGDGWPEVVLASPGFWLPVMFGNDVSRVGGVRAWRVDGSEVDFDPQSPATGLIMEASGAADTLRFPPAALADLDGDGRLEVVAASIQDRAYYLEPPLSRLKKRSSVYAWSLPAPFASGAAPWPAYQGGPLRNGRFFRPPPPNRPPRLRDVPSQTIAVGETFRPLTLDRYAEDPDGRVSRLTWTISGARELRVTLDAQRILQVEPPSPTWEGREQLRLVVRDPAGAEAETTVTFAARPGYRPPKAFADQVETAEDEALEFDPTINDLSPASRPLRVIGVSRPEAGQTAVLPGGRVRYQPDPDFYGTDLFEYQLADDDGGFAIGEIRVVVSPRPDAPRPEPDRLILDEDTSAEIDLLANDVEVDGEPLAVLGVDPPEAGVFDALGAGRFRFVPPTNYFGVQTFTYRVGDPTGLISTGEVAILVKPVNDEPVARDQTVTLNRNRSADIFYNAQDADGETLSFSIVDPPAHGTLLTYPTIANYQPAKDFSGEDHFQYTATDGHSSVGPVRVTLVVTSTNNAPEVDSVSSVTAMEQSLTLGLNVRDADAEPTTLAIVDFPLHGGLRLEGTNVTYTPEAGYLGTDTFTFQASDGAAVSEPGTATIRVTDENTAPTAISEIRFVPRNQSYALTLRATDPENNPLQFQVVTNPVLGRLDGVAPRLTYTPLSNFTGIDRLFFRVADRQLTSAVAVVHLWVREPNQLPVTTNQTLRVIRDTPAFFRLGVRDADGNSLRAAVLRGPSVGRLYGVGVDYTYVPRPGFLGSDTFTYKVWDGYGYSPAATVTVLVEEHVPVTVEIVGARLSAEGFELLARSEPGWTLALETSRDLVSWLPLAQAVNGTGTWRWVDVREPSEEGRFYRVKVIESPEIP